MRNRNEIVEVTEVDAATRARSVNPNIKEKMRGRAMNGHAWDCFGERSIRAAYRNDWLTRWRRFKKLSASKKTKGKPPAPVAAASRTPCDQHWASGWAFDLVERANPRGFDMTERGQLRIAIRNKRKRTMTRGARPTPPISGKKPSSPSRAIRLNL